MASVFIGFKHLNWFRLWVIIGAVYLFWLGLATVLPPKIHAAVLAVIGAAQSALVFVIRATKYVETRQEVPPPGQQP